MIPRTAQMAGYAHICAATGKANTAVQEKIKHTHAPALANLVTTTTANRQAVGTLSTTFSILTAERCAATELIKKLQCQLTLYTNVSLTPPATPTPRACVPIDPKGYFWFHGYCVITAHNGCMCDNMLLDHKKHATHKNPMGGSMNNKPE